MISYSTLIETMKQCVYLVRFSIYGELFVNIGPFDFTHLHLSPP